MAKSHLLPWLLLLPTLCGPGTGELPQPLSSLPSHLGPGMERASHYPLYVHCPFMAAPLTCGSSPARD